MAEEAHGLAELNEGLGRIIELPSSAGSSKQLALIMKDLAFNLIGLKVLAGPPSTCKLSLML